MIRAHFEIMFPHVSFSFYFRHKFRGRESGGVHETLIIARHEMYINFYGASEKSERLLNECQLKKYGKIYE